MARTKPQEQKTPEVKPDATATDESTAQPTTAAEQSGDGSAADAAATGTTANPDTAPPAPPSDEPEQETEPSVDRAVLILRDETLGDTDYKPGATPHLVASDADYLIARGAADDNPKAVAAARKARGTGAKQEQAIE